MLLLPVLMWRSTAWRTARLSKSLGVISSHLGGWWYKAQKGTESGKQIFSFFLTTRAKVAMAGLIHCAQTFFDQ